MRENDCVIDACDDDEYDWYDDDEYGMIMMMAVATAMIAQHTRIITRMDAAEFNAEMRFKFSKLHLLHGERAVDGACACGEGWGLGFGVWGLGFGDWGLGIGGWGLGIRVWGLGFGIWDFGFGG